MTVDIIIKIQNRIYIFVFRKVMLQTVWNTTGGITSQTVFTVVLLAVIVGWILVSLWTRVIENAAFGTFGFNEDSLWDSLLIAFAVTTIFISFVWMVDRYGYVSNLAPDVNTNEEISGVSTSTTLSRNTPDHLSRNNNGNPIAIF